MPKIPRIKAKDFFKYLRKFGCEEISIKGSHHKVRYTKNNKVSVVAIHTNEILYPGMFLGILNELEINSKEFIEFMNKS
jgi:predicted RNA binding protein YcfA (HicA-like mRNA interferase family)